MKILKYTAAVQKQTTTKTKPEPWLHIALLNTDFNNYYYAIYVWDTRKVIESGKVSTVLPIKGHSAVDNHKELTGGDRNISIINNVFAHMNDDASTNSSKQRLNTKLGKGKGVVQQTPIATDDIDKLAPTELFKAYNIPNTVLYQIRSKKGREYARTPMTLSDNTGFISELKHCIKRFGKPVSVDRRQIDTFDNNAYQRAARNELEFEYRKGSVVVVHFKNDKGVTRDLFSEQY